MWAVIIIIVIIVVLGLFLVGIYNGMVRGRNRVDEAWSGIDVQLKRRHDLIPNLVETVKGYAAHESEVFEAVTQARAAAMSAQGAGAGAAAGRRRADRSARQAVRRRRGLPAAARDRELPAAAGRADEHRGSDRRRAPHLQRQRAGLQHAASRRSPRRCSRACSASSKREFFEIDSPGRPRRAGRLVRRGLRPPAAARPLRDTAAGTPASAPPGRPGPEP